jgi:hypothetical protein
MRTRNLLPVAALLAVSLVGCLTPVPMTPGVQREAEKLVNQWLQFGLPPENSDAAWARAQTWIGRMASDPHFAVAPLATVRDSMIETAPAGFGGSTTSFIVTREAIPAAGYIHFTVEYRWSGPLPKIGLGQAKALAHYIQTGEDISYALTIGRL